MIRWLAVLLWPIAAAIYLCGSARADLGGSVPSPGNCDYPAIGNWGLDGPGVYHWVCDFPTEVNGAHHHCQAGGAATQLTVGVSFLFVNAGVTTPTGVIPGICYWACPDLTVSEPPNPPGAWKNYVKPAVCKTIGPNPLTPPEAPRGESLVPPGVPLPTAPAPPPLTGAVTNPDNPNPDATQNP